MDNNIKIKKRLEKLFKEFWENNIFNLKKRKLK